MLQKVRIKQLSMIWGAIVPSSSSDPRLAASKDLTKQMLSLCPLISLYFIKLSYVGVHVFMITYQFYRIHTAYIYLYYKVYEIYCRARNIKIAWKFEISISEILCLNRAGPTHVAFLETIISLLYYTIKPPY